jgi:hypothetical protein
MMLQSRKIVFLHRFSQKSLQTAEVLQRRKKSAPDPRVSDFHKAFERQFQQHTGRPYTHGNYGAEGAQIRRALKAHGSVEAVAAGLDRYFTDVWQQTHGHGFTILGYLGRLNNYLTSQSGPPRPEPAGDQAAQPTPDELEVFRAWDEHPYIVGQSESRTEHRNYPLKPSEEQEALTWLRKCLAAGYTTEKLRKTVGRYFACCYEGRHLWDGRNHGFRSLVGLLRRLASKPSVEPWWEGGAVELDDWGKKVKSALTDTLPDGEKVDDTSIEIAARKLKELSESYPVSRTELLESLCLSLSDWLDEKLVGRSVSRLLADGNTWDTRLPRVLEYDLGIGKRAPETAAERPTGTLDAQKPE